MSGTETLCYRGVHALAANIRRRDLSPVEVTDAGAEDPLLGRLPRRFDAFHWHYYTYDLPDAAVELARSPTCTQALRLGESTWGIQFHAEVTLPQIELWTE